MPFICISSFFSFVHINQIFRNTFLKHIQHLLLDFDPVKDEQHQNFKSNEQHLEVLKIHTTYLFPALSMIAIAIETHWIYFQAWLTENTELLNSLLARRLMPRSFWAQSDAITELGLAMTTVTYCCLLLETKLPFKYHMVLLTQNSKPALLQNGRLLEPSETNQILRIRRSTLRLIRGTIVTVFLFITTFFLNCFRLTWSAEHSWTMTTVKFLELIIFSLYLPLTNAYLIFYFLLVVQYIQIKQKVTAEKIESLNKRNFWRTFSQLNQSNARIFDEICQNYWSKYLSIYFCVYIVEIVYMSYTMLFNSVALFDRLFFGYIMVIFVTLLMTITLECSRVVGANQKFHNKMKKIGTQQLRLKHKKSLILKVFQLLKLDLMIAGSEHLPNVCFKLLNGYRINSQMFQSVS